MSVSMEELQEAQTNVSLSRNLGLMGLTATGICSMLGAAINIVPFMLLRNVPEIGPYVLPAYMFAAVPAVFAAMAYAALSSAMPRAGGSYIFASRALNPYLGFIASFAQWFGLSIAIGVISYVMIPFFRDVAVALGWSEVAAMLEHSVVRPVLALVVLWGFLLVNIRGNTLYQRVLIPLMILMFLMGSVVIFAGFFHDQVDFVAGLAANGESVPDMAQPEWGWSTFMAAAAILFSSFIGFDSIAQAGGEAKNPGKSLPLAFGLAIGVVGLFYFLFTAAVYHTVPWQYIAVESQQQDLTAPGLLGYVLSPGWTILIVAAAAIALANDLPAMLVAVSRLMFSWAEDGIFPERVARIHPRFHTPVIALVASGVMASFGILGSHFAGDFFLGVDILVTSMLVNFLLMCVSLLYLRSRNPEISKGVTVFKSLWTQRIIGLIGAVLLLLFLIVHIIKDLNAEQEAWYFHSTPIWLIVMAIASAIFFWKMKKIRDSGVDIEERFSTLPQE